MKTLLPAVLGVALLVPPSSAEACGSFPDVPLYFHTTHPDRPFAPFAAGRLGVLREWYQPVYLAYAYRTMMGVPTTADEQRHLVETWSRIEGDVRLPGTDEAVKRWLAARAEMAPALPPATPLAVGEADYAQYARIQGDAFLKAADTAAALAREWKERPALVEEWVRNQDIVFGPCGTRPSLDAKLDASLKPAQQVRRQAEYSYQQAATSFYCGEYDGAAEAFQNISRSPGSPYQALGAYLVARTRVRQALFGTKLNTGLSMLGWDRDDLATDPVFIARLMEADRLLGQVLATPEWAQMHGPARRLQSLVRSRLRPATWRCELLSRVLEPGTGASLAAELGDLNVLGWKVTDCQGLPAPAAELAAWLATTRDESSPPYSYQPEHRDADGGPRSLYTHGDATSRKAYATAVDRWKQTGHLPWLVTALMKARTDSPGLDALLADAAKVSPASPAGVTLAYRSAHLLRELGDVKAAQARLEAVPLELTKDQVTTDNLLRQERFAVARSWEELFRFSTRRLAGMATPESHSDALDTPPDARPVAFGEEVMPVLEPRLTTRRLAELAASEALRPNQRRWLSWTAFARAAVVGDDETLRALAKSLAATEPAAKEELLAIDSRPTPAERRFEAQVLIMGLPTVSARLQPAGSYLMSENPKVALTYLGSGKSGWCAPKEDGPVSPFPFMTEAEQQAAAAEWKVLTDARQAGDSVSYYARVALDWAKAHPEDPRSPKALYRAVRAGRYGYSCNQGADAVKEALRHLREHYKNSPWTKKAASRN